MLIRCERCSTVYELDEKLLPPTGAPVQCTRCQHVFTAAPPQAPGRTLPAFPAVAPAPSPVLAAQPSPPEAVSAPPPAPAPPPPSPPHAAPRAPAVAPRAAPRQASRPAPSKRGPRADTIQMFAQQVRSRSRWMWLGPLLAVLAGAGGYAGWRYQASRIDPAALQKDREGLSILARDDGKSLERAVAVLAEGSQIDPKLYRAEADRALAMVLLSAALREDAADLEARFKALDAERVRLETEKADGWARRQGEIVERMKPLRAELDPMQEKARSLAEQAYGILKPLAREHGDDLAVERALAVYYALDGNAEQSARFVRNARLKQSDPWVDLAEGAADVTAADAPATRARAVARLGSLVVAHPDLLRARMLLARAQTDLGRTDAAVAALDGVVAANPDHERARRLKAELLTPPAPEAAPAAAPPAAAPRAAAPVKAPPPRKAGKLSRRGARRR